MFDQVQTAPPDPILGLSEAFSADPNPNKINLGVGVYKDAEGKTPVLESVKEAERRLLDTEASKGYLPITGSPKFAADVQAMLMGRYPPIVVSERATAHTPGGTGALRVVGDYIKRMNPDIAVWLSRPTWANHAGIFQAAGVATREYAYFDPSTNHLNWDAFIADLKSIPTGDVVLLHGCCHNPTGMDPTDEQWDRIADIVAQRALVPLLDFAYQGFADGLEEDAVGLRALAERVGEMFICSSFSKNFGLYCERTGAVTLVARTSDAAKAAMSHLKACIRTNYSSPPAHGGEIVATILDDADLTRQWVGELAVMRDRINGMRKLFVDTLQAKGVTRDFSFITHQRGMFSFSGLTPEQVDALRERHAIYIVRSGRINVAGMTEANMPTLCQAIADVL